MKKIFYYLLLSCSLSLVVGCQKNEKVKNVKIGIITDYRDPVKQDSNIKTMFELCSKFCKDNKIEYISRIPNYDQDANRETSIRILIDNGCNTIITLGSSFAKPLNNVVNLYPYHKFIALDLSKEDMYNAYFDDYDFDIKNEKWNNYQIPSNIYALDYKVEEASYALGTTLVNEGYDYLNFVGNYDKVEINRIGYSFIKGIKYQSEKINKEVHIRYAYTSYNEVDDDIVRRFDTWNGIGEYNQKKIYFCCGGKTYLNALTSATKKGVSNVEIISNEYDYTNGLKEEFKNAYLGALIKDYKKYVPSFLKGIIIDKNIEGGIKEYPLNVIDYQDVNYNPSFWNFKNITQEDHNDMVKKLLLGEVKFDKSLKGMNDVLINDEEIDYQGSIK